MALTMYCYGRLSGVTTASKNLGNQVKLTGTNCWLNISRNDIDIVTTIVLTPLAETAAQAPSVLFIRGMKQEHCQKKPP